MTRRTSVCYQSIFKYINKNVLALEPGEIITDFETGLRHAIRKSFPNAILRGCWYHYCAAIRKKLLFLLSSSLFKTNGGARIIKKQLMCLPLLPAENFHEGYQYIKSMTERYGLSERFKGFFTYFEFYWFTQVILHFFGHFQS